MPYQPFQRNYYRGGGGAGFGGNAWVSLMGGAAQGLLAAQKNRAELIKEAQQEALRRAAEQRAIDSSAREQERLEMARKTQEEATKARMKAEEERQRAIRKEREEEAARRQRYESLKAEYGARPDMTDYYTETEIDRIAWETAGGAKPVRPPKPPKDEVVGDRFVRTPPTTLKMTAAEKLDEWDKRFLGNVGGPNMSMEGPTTLPPAQGNVIFHEGKPVTDPALAYQLKLVPELRAKIAQNQRDLETLPKTSEAYLRAVRDLEMNQALLDEVIRRVSGGSGGDFAQQGFDYSGVSTSPGR